MKKLLTVLLALTLLTALAGLAEPLAILGQPLPDFTVETIDGNTFTLSEALKDHDMVLINLWATWCPPCEREFPFMQEAYEQYKDRVAVVALSVEPKDTPEVLTEYANAHGMTFPIGSDGKTNLADTFVTIGIPTSVVVDRFGNVALVEAGAKVETSAFVNLFEYFLQDGYTATTVLEGFPTNAG